MTIVEIIAAIDRVAADLEHIAAVLDGNIFALDDVRDRGALNRVRTACIDCANGLRANRLRGPR